MLKSDLRKHLTVEDDLLVEKRVDEATVVETVWLHSCTNTSVPELTKSTLLETSITVSIGSSLHDGLLGPRENSRSTRSETFGHLEDLFVLGM